jgi:hypothetical protein
VHSAERERVRVTEREIGKREGRTTRTKTVLFDFSLQSLQLFIFLFRGLIQSSWCVGSTSGLDVYLSRTGESTSRTASRGTSGEMFWTVASLWSGECWVEGTAFRRTERAIIFPSFPCCSFLIESSEETQRERKREREKKGESSLGHRLCWRSVDSWSERLTQTKVWAEGALLVLPSLNVLHASIVCQSFHIEATERRRRGGGGRRESVRTRKEREQTLQFLLLSSSEA